MFITGTKINNIKMVLLQFILCAMTVYIVFCIVQSYKFRRILNKIPSPPGHWLIGNMDFLLKNPQPDAIFQLLRDCAKKHWPIYRFSSPYIVTINFLHPGDLEIILSQMKHLSKSKIYSYLENWLGKGLLTSTGSKWQSRRKILTQAFHFNILQQFLKVFNEETTNFIKQLEIINAKTEKLEHINILPLLTNMTLESISETAMGISNIDENTQQMYRNSVHKMGKLLLTRITNPLIRHKLIYSLTNQGKEEKVTIKNLHDFTYRVIKEREQQIINEKHETLVSTSYSGRKIMRMLDLLLLAKINDKSIDFEGIREEVDTFMFEGHDTTSAAIGFLLYSLAKHPDIQEEVRKEIQEVLGSKTDPTYNDLQDLSYTEMVIKETLRLYPSVPFISRIASENFVSHTGYQIPKGTILHIHIFDLHRDPRIYPDPLKFDPNRFTPENSTKRHPFAYLPFSAGPRNCIGQKFAILEIKSAVCGILRKFKLEDGTQDIKFLPDLILRVEDEIKLKFVPI